MISSLSGNGGYFDYSVGRTKGGGVGFSTVFVEVDGTDFLIGIGLIGSYYISS
jgi:hypothetical protein